MKLLHSFVLLIFASSCATVSSHNILSQPENQRLTASIGSVLFSLSKQSDLPNAFGGKDIYGGKVDKGFTELRLKAINGSVLTLELSDLNKQSNETTMDRYGAKPLAQVNNNISFASQTPNKTQFEFDLRKEKSLSSNSIKITFLKATSYSVEYQLSRLY